MSGSSSPHPNTSEASPYFRHQVFDNPSTTSTKQIWLHESWPAIKCTILLRKERRTRQQSLGMWSLCIVVAQPTSSVFVSSGVGVRVATRPCTSQALQPRCSTEFSVTSKIHVLRGQQQATQRKSVML